MLSLVVFHTEKYYFHTFEHSHIAYAYTVEDPNVNYT